MGELKTTDSITEEFGSLVFDQSAMELYVPAAALASYRRCLKNSTSLPMDTANAIAEGMKNWAVERGATHFTHWFQPLTGETAEKHESFIRPDGYGRAVTEFSGSELVRGEPDASSFPSGGLRATFEARGYSAWDPTANAFIKGGTLCIPTVFCSYSGQALDKKTPLLRSMKAVSVQAVRILRLFGDKKTKKVIPQAGPEQEYFLIDKAMYLSREDLRNCGRTLFGAKPPKTQELDDHYYGAIKPRVAEFMRDLDRELWKVGVPAKTRHNEVAPAQHELAPFYTDCNRATDQNQLTMEMMKRVADRHNFVCLLHEKPFYGVNGSGKHNNWSLATDTGENLFSPGETPAQNAQFMLFLAAFVMAVDNYPELLRCSVAFAGNDQRLGGEEAPPAIISIFVGDELEAVIDTIVNGEAHDGNSGPDTADKRSLRIGVDVIPRIPKDTTDRNRTSPIAFTGNKFEFRMPGSSQSIAGPNTVLNTIMAESLSEFADRLENAADFNAELHSLIRETFIKHGRVIFNGNGYNDQWLEEAHRRGLPNLKSTADALPLYTMPKNVSLMEKHGVYTREEMAARDEIHYEKYCKVVSIEAGTLVNMIRRRITAAVSGYEKELCSTAAAKRDVIPSADISMETELAQRLAGQNKLLAEKAEALNRAAASIPSGRDEMLLYCRDVICAEMESIRQILNGLEAVVPKEYWRYPAYEELMFSE